jgi:hypothetical protein
MTASVPNTEVTLIANMTSSDVQERSSIQEQMDEGASSGVDHTHIISSDSEYELVSQGVPWVYEC